ncbi:hypothetical protein L596_027506 [Steinernema carpocapsae]|uniref:Uncharacterized protein n=1 Tax=Steinernema carpocapsae TaxID=34508 RepID=A0A4U5LVP0_STECR|nr:hypothetical protein L596_027506 [Steinernema carpocapsae]
MGPSVQIFKEKKLQKLPQHHLQKNYLFFANVSYSTFKAKAKKTENISATFAQPRNIQNKSARPKILAVCKVPETPYSSQTSALALDSIKYILFIACNLPHSLGTKPEIVRNSETWDPLDRRATESKDDVAVVLSMTKAF